MEEHYYKITVHIKGRAKPLGGIRCFPTNDLDTVYKSVLNSLLKYYYLTDIIKIDAWWMPPYSEEYKEYVKNQF